MAYRECGSFSATRHFNDKRRISRPKKVRGVAGWSRAQGFGGTPRLGLPPYKTTARRRADAGGDPPIGFGGTPLSGLPPYDRIVAVVTIISAERPFGASALRFLCRRADAGGDPPIGFGGTPRWGFYPTDAPRRSWGRSRRRSADSIRWNAPLGLPPYEHTEPVVGRMPESIRRLVQVERPFRGFHPTTSIVEINLILSFNYLLLMHYDLLLINYAALCS